MSKKNEEIEIKLDDVMKDIERIFDGKLTKESKLHFIRGYISFKLYSTHIDGRLQGMKELRESTKI